MNWQISASAADLAKADVEVSRGDGETGDLEPDKTLVRAARQAAQTLSKALGQSKDLWVSVAGHETTSAAAGEFAPHHVSVTVSRVDRAGQRAQAKAQARAAGG